jgi:hypothetical protein
MQADRLMIQFSLSMVNALGILKENLCLSGIFLLFCSEALLENGTRHGKAAGTAVPMTNQKTCFMAR